MDYHQLLLFAVFHFLNFNNISIVECSGRAQKSEGFWNAVTKVTSSIFMGKASVESNPSYAKLYEYEVELKKKFDQMTESISNDPQILGEDLNNKKIIQFSEASAFSSVFIRNIGGHLDTWMDLVESKKDREGSKILSQHILWIRSVGSVASTSYFIYRPSFEAELDSSTVLPHLKYHAEAERTAGAVVDIVKMYPNDQIVFAGLQSGGAIAMLHSWFVAASVPIVHRNLVRFKGELHQIKVLMFDTDCVLSKSNGKSYPIPSWDILKFYSGLSNDISADFCKFDSLDPSTGLAYSYKRNTLDFTSLTAGFTPIRVDRTQFLNYYMEIGSKNDSEVDQFLVHEAVDNGFLDGAFDDSASLADSDISVSIAEGFHIKSPPISNLKSVNSIETLILPGTCLLIDSIKRAEFFSKNVKEIYNQHKTAYLRRNVNECAAAMQDKLTNSLLGSMSSTLNLERDINRISCEVDSYNEKTKFAIIICSFIGTGTKSTSKLSTFKFKTHLQNDMNKVFEKLQVVPLENEWDEVRSDSNSSEAPSYLQQLRQRSRSDFSADDQSIMTSDFNRVKGSPWSNCLEILFEKSSHLSFINPCGNRNQINDLVTEGTRKVQAGESEIQIQLPFSSSSAFCMYSLESKPKNFHQLYLVNPNMFFSIFTELIKPDNSFPAACNNCLAPPAIHSHGNAQFFSQILNRYFNSDGITEINQKNVIVNGLEITESVTNLESKNPYEIFNPALSGKLAKCLARSVLDRMYDCNSHLTLWAGKHLCPSVCRYQDGTSLHLCSRVVDCGDGVFIGFRGGKTLGTKIIEGKAFVKEPALKDEFVSRSILSRASDPAYYAAFHLKYVDGFSDAIRNPIRFAVFFNLEAKRNFIEISSANPSAISTANQSFNGVVGSVVGTNDMWTNERPGSALVDYNQYQRSDSISVNSISSGQRRKISRYISPAVPNSNLKPESLNQFHDFSAINNEEDNEEYDRKSFNGSYEDLNDLANRGVVAENENDKETYEFSLNYNNSPLMTELINDHSDESIAEDQIKTEQEQVKAEDDSVITSNIKNDLDLTEIVEESTFTPDMVLNDSTTPAETIITGTISQSTSQANNQSIVTGQGGKSKNGKKKKK